MLSQNVRPARIVKIWLDAILVLGSIGGALLGLWLILSPFVMSAPGGYADASFRVSIGERSIMPVIHLDIVDDKTATDTHPEFRRPRIVKGRAELRFETTNWALQCMSSITYWIAILVLLYVTYGLRSILATVLEGNPFVAANSRRLRRIGFVLIGAGLTAPVLEYVSARIVLSRIALSGVELSAPIDVVPGLLLGGLMLLALSTVFGHGARLEEDRSLTV